MSDEGTDPTPIPPRPPAPAWVAAPAQHPQQSSALLPQQPAWPAPPQPAWPAPPQQAPLFAAPYADAPRGSFVERAAPRSAALGVTALVLAVLAAGGASVAGAVAATQIAQGVGPSAFSSPQGPSDLAFLSPVRDWVLLGEVSFWIGTVVGIWAIVQGVVAIVTGRGRVAAIVAVVVAVLGPILFFAAVTIAVVAVVDTGPVLGV